MLCCVDVGLNIFEGLFFLHQYSSIGFVTDYGLSFERACNKKVTKGLHVHGCMGPPGRLLVSPAYTRTTHSRAENSSVFYLSPLRTELILGGGGVFSLFSKCLILFFLFLLWYPAGIFRRPAGYHTQLMTHPPPPHHPQKQFGLTQERGQWKFGLHKIVMMGPRKGPPWTLP